MAEKSIEEQIRELQNRWNPPPEDHTLERIVGVPTDEGDTRVTGHVPMEELNAHVNPASDSVDAQRLGEFSGEDDEEDDGDGEGYDALTIPELKDELRERDLPVSGTKPELVARLEEDDASDDEGEDDTA